METHGSRAGRVGWAAALLLGAAGAGCTPDADDLQPLLVREIHASFPDYAVTDEPGERLCVHRPFRRDVIVDVARMADDCRLGPEECDRSTQEMMDTLR